MALVGVPLEENGATVDTGAVNVVPAAGGFGYNRDVQKSRDGGPPLVQSRTQ